MRDVGLGKEYSLREHELRVRSSPSSLERVRFELPVRFGDLWALETA